MGLIGSTFEIESCGCSQIEEEKTLGGPALRRRTKSGTSSRGEFQEGKNKWILQEDAEDAKKRKKRNPLQCSEIHVRVQFRSSVNEIIHIGLKNH